MSKESGKKAESEAEKMPAKSNATADRQKALEIRKKADHAGVKVIRGRPKMRKVKTRKRKIWSWYYVVVKREN